MSNRAPRKTLTRAAVTAAAVDLADREGLDAVSMRRLAQELDVVPMATYKHLADKEDLLDAMVDRVIEGWSGLSVDPETTWPQRVAGLALAARAGLAAHPWLRRAIETRARRTPAVLRHMEAVTACFLDGGLSADLTHHAMHALGNRIWGFSPELFNPGPGGVPGRSTAPPVDPAELPSILTIAQDASQRRPGAVGCDEDAEFGFALDLILHAVARLHAAGWDSGQLA